MNFKSVPSPLRRLFAFLAEEAMEKLNVVETWRSIKALGVKYGTRMVVFGVIWELIEDGLFPYLSYMAGLAFLIPFFLVMHFEPLVYPMAIKGFRTYDRMKGLEPWDPDRRGKSTLWRSALQAVTYRVPALVIFTLLLANLGLSQDILVYYTMGMTFFAMVHDRTWHDSNYGIIEETDEVQLKRVVAKVGTYRLVSALVMGGLFVGLAGGMPWQMWAYQLVMLAIHFGLTYWWAKSPIGIRPVVREAK